MKGQICKSYVDTPEFLDGVECNDLLKQIIPVVSLQFVSRWKASRSAQTHLSRGWLSEPERPLVHQRVLDIEVVFIMEDGDLFRGINAWLLVFIAAICALR